ncbi:MAG: hypothetical protein ACYC61_12020 [Isosphaeraceae bacterium]
MLKSLSLKSDPISQPATEDPLERLTWCSLRIQVGSRFASRLWDRLLEDERDYIDVPAFPIAEWLIKNWWSLFNELCPGNSIPVNPAVDASWLRWTRRHCLRAADSSLFLPKLFLYTDSSSLLAESHADRPGSMPNMPGEFLNEGVTQLDPDDAEAALAKFIRQTLNRVEGVASDRVTRAAGQWHAIVNADPEEVEFCRLAGRMGLDPYDREEMTEDLAAFFESMLTDADDPLVRDLTEAAKPESVQALWNWVRDASQALHLGPSSAGLPFELPARRSSPAEYGYEVARRVRAFAGVGDLPIDSVEKVASAATNRSFEVVPRNHIPGKEIKAVVGETGSGNFVVAGPESRTLNQRRFMSARGLFHALATSRSSQRLVTDAYSTDQKASRAFAAELLAPRRGLLDRLPGSTADPETVESLGKEFQASNYVIQLQLGNAGVAFSSD